MGLRCGAIWARSATGVPAEVGVGPIRLRCECRVGGGRPGVAVESRMGRKRPGPRASPKQKNGQEPLPAQKI